MPRGGVRNTTEVACKFSLCALASAVRRRIVSPRIFPDCNTKKKKSNVGNFTVFPVLSTYKRTITWRFRGRHERIATTRRTVRSTEENENENGSRRERRRRKRARKITVLVRVYNNQRCILRRTPGQFIHSDGRKTGGGGIVSYCYIVVIKIFNGGLRETCNNTIPFYTAISLL